MSESRAAWVRPSIACAASTLLTLFLWSSGHWSGLSAREHAFFFSMTMVPLLAGALVMAPALSAQLLARGIWWALLLLGSIGTTAGDPVATQSACVVALASGGALLAAGAAGLDDAGGGRFRPVAFRGTLLLALVLAMADTTSLLWYALGDTLFEGRRSAALFLLIVPMAASVVGLLRLRTWGLLLGMLCNVALATLALTGVLAMPDALRALYVGTATLQLLVPLPMLVALVRKRVPAPERFRAAKGAVATAAIVAIAALDVWSAFFRHR